MQLDMDLEEKGRGLFQGTIHVCSNAWTPWYHEDVRRKWRQTPRILVSALNSGFELHVPTALLPAKRGR